MWAAGVLCAWPVHVHAGRGKRGGRCGALGTCAGGRDAKGVTNLSKVVGELRKALVEKVWSGRGCPARRCVGTGADVVRVFVVWLAACAFLVSHYARSGITVA